MDISEEGNVSGSVNRAELIEAYANATDDNVKANLASAAAEHGMHVEGDQLVDPSAQPPESPQSPASEPVTTEAPASEPAGPGGRYDDLSKQELQDELANRGLATSGNKDELVARLEEADGS